jgi:hypothetical protein
MNKADRQRVYDKYCGKCAYCGCDLEKGWHVDELLPVVRGYSYDKDEYGKRLKDKNGRDRKTPTMEYPERKHIDNQMPACASCNITKSSLSLENFRSLVAGFINSLNSYNNIYRMAKRYNLLQETGGAVRFYFEKFQTKEGEK